MPRCCARSACAPARRPAPCSPTQASQGLPQRARRRAAHARAAAQALAPRPMAAATSAPTTLPLVADSPLPVGGSSAVWKVCTTPASWCSTTGSSTTLPLVADSPLPVGGTSNVWYALVAARCCRTTTGPTIVPRGSAVPVDTTLHGMPSSSADSAADGPVVSLPYGCRRYSAHATVSVLPVVVGALSSSNACAIFRSVAMPPGGYPDWRRRFQTPDDLLADLLVEAALAGRFARTARDRRRPW